MSIDLNNVQSDLHHLAHLIDTVADLFGGCDFGTTNNRHEGMDRINSLIWIARDISNSLAKTIDDNFQSIGSTTSAATLDANARAPRDD